MAVKIAYFDPFSGASGDMILGALLDAGLSLPALRAELGKVDLTGYRLRAEPVSQHGLHGTRVTVEVEEGSEERDWAAIRTLLEGSALREGVKRFAIIVFERLA